MREKNPERLFLGSDWQKSCLVIAKQDWGHRHCVWLVKVCPSANSPEHGQLGK